MNDGSGTVDTATTEDEVLAALLDQSDAERFRDRWQSIQGTFVDEPKQSVEEADALVTEVIQRLTETFQQERQSLESQLDSDNVSTEDRRVALQRYRSFFERLLETS
ncbi:MAG TPA: hypothetical protein VIZ44_13670 [Gaiellaceae bacterium]|jgi:hypothetical protein